MQMLGLENIQDGDGWVKASCPFAPNKHTSGTDSSPSFGIQVGQTSFYHCFSCKSADNLPMLVSNLIYMRNRDYPEARAHVAKYESFALDPYETGEAEQPLSILAEGILHKFAEAHEDLSIVRKRKITIDAIDRFGLQWDIAEARLIFPVRDEDGHLVGIRGRVSAFGRSKAKYREYRDLSPNQSSLKAHGIWYGMQFWPEDGKKLILVEGELDVIKLWEKLRRNGIWGMMGGGLHRAQIKRIGAANRPVILFFDNDEAGRELTNKMINKLKKHVPISIVTKYGGCNDAAEMVEKGRLRPALESIGRAT